MLTAQIAEQAAVIKDLKARPKKEEVMVAERALDVARKREKFSRERVPRMERLYKDRAISFEEYDAARRDCEVDVDEVAKRAADLALVKTGVTPDKIAAEKAKLDSLVEERATLSGKVERTDAAHALRRQHPHAAPATSGSTASSRRASRSPRSRTRAR